MAFNTAESIGFAVLQLTITTSVTDLDFVVGVDYNGGTKNLKGAFDKIIVINLESGKTLGFEFRRNIAADLSATEGTIRLPGGGVHTENVLSPTWISLISDNASHNIQLILYKGGLGST